MLPPLYDLDQLFEAIRRGCFLGFMGRYAGSQRISPPNRELAGWGSEPKRAQRLRKIINVQPRTVQSSSRIGDMNVILPGRVERRSCAGKQGAISA
jgi:hypothetical protein